MAEVRHSRAGGNPLPEGWVKSHYGAFLDLQNGYAFKSSTYVEHGAFVIRIGNVQEGLVSLHNPAYVDLESHKNSPFKLDPDDVLVSLTGNVGRVAIIKQEQLPAVLNQRVARVIRSSGINWKYAFYSLQSKYTFDEIMKTAKGAAQLNVSTKDILNIQVPLPPLAEQKVIAEKLDTLLAQVDTTKARLERIPDIIKRFRQSVLAAAVSGKLTEEWRGVNGRADFVDISWNEILRDKKESFKRGPFGSALKKSMFVESGFKVYEQYCPINDDCSYSRYYITPEKYEEMRAFEVKEGDFLISCSGVSLGRITQVPAGSEPGIINQALLRVRLNNDLYDDDFFKLVFRSPAFQKAIFANSTGSAIPNLKGVKELKAMRLPLPTLDEQTEIVRRVEDLFAFADSIEQKATAALGRVNNLTQSILAKAFRGELTADWRAANPELISGDNSAEALLAKIQAEREKLALEKKAAKKPRKKKAKA